MGIKNPTVGGRRWGNLLIKELFLFNSFRTISNGGLRRSSTRDAISARICIGLRIGSSILTIGKDNTSNYTLFTSNIRNRNRVFPTSRGFCQSTNLRQCTFVKGFVQAVILRCSSLRSNNNRTALSNNLFLVRLINIASQSGDQQGGQDGQDDENNDELDEGEALLVSSFCEFSRTL